VTLIKGDNMATKTWYIRDADGRIIGHTDECAWGTCAEKHIEGGIYCAPHDVEAAKHYAADRAGWGIAIG